MKKIAIIGSIKYGGEGKATRALIEFLQLKGFEVLYFCDSPSHSKLGRWYNKQLGRGKRILTGGFEGDPYIKNLAGRIKSSRFMAAISVGTSEILLHDLDCIKIFFCRAPADHETYFKRVYYASHRSRATAGRPDILDIVAAEKEKQLAAFQASDYVTFAWKTYEE